MLFYADQSARFYSPKTFFYKRVSRLNNGETIEAGVFNVKTGQFNPIQVPIINKLFC